MLGSVRDATLAADYFKTQNVPRNSLTQTTLEEGSSWRYTVNVGVEERQSHHQDQDEEFPGIRL